MLEGVLAASRDGGDELVGAGARGLDVLGADFEDLFEVCRHVRDFVLQEEDDIVVVLTLLVRGSGCSGRGMGGLVEGLQIRYLRIDTCEVLFDNVGQLRNFHRSIVEEGLAPSKLSQPLEFAHRRGYRAPYLGGVSRELRSGLRSC